MKNDQVLVIGGAYDQQVVDLNDLMEFDNVIETFGDGTAKERDDLYAPEVFDDYIEKDGFSTRGGQKWKFTGDDQWELLYDITGQYGYNGPVMHDSEVIGGGLAEKLITEPGVYVCVIVSTLDAEEDCSLCQSNDEGDGNPRPCDQHDIVGWAVAKLKQ